MAASSAKIFDISDVGPVETTGGDVTHLQEAAKQGLGTLRARVTYFRSACGLDATRGNQ